MRAAGCVWAEDEAQLIVGSAASPAEVAALVARRSAGEPIEQVLGWAEFCGLRVQLLPGVFVPRRRTEFLASRAAALAAPGSVVLDLCCGSGAIAAAVAESLLPDRAELWASDVDPVAVECARSNLERYGATVLRSDLYENLPASLQGRVDVLVANVPYVATPDLRLLPAEARDHEPRRSLDGGADGLDVFRRVVAAAPAWLAPGATLLSEVTVSQADDALAVVRSAGLRGAISTDHALDATVVTATR